MLACIPGGLIVIGISDVVYKQTVSGDVKVWRLEWPGNKRFDLSLVTLASASRPKCWLRFENSALALSIRPWP